MASTRLRIAGRVDYLAVTTGNRIVIVEAKLAQLTRRKLARSQHLRAQLAAYTIAAEETLKLPLEAAYIYTTENGALIPVTVTPRDRMLVEHAAKTLHQALERGEPPHTPPPPAWKCRVCSYRSICPFKR